jgi:hypothetical protein
MKDRFFQFSWRPRNASLLTAEQERDILKNLKKYSEKFAKDDDIILQQVRGAFHSQKADSIFTSPIDAQSLDVDADSLHASNTPAEPRERQSMANLIRTSSIHLHRVCLHR